MATYNEQRIKLQETIYKANQLIKNASILLNDASELADKDIDKRILIRLANELKYTFEEVSENLLADDTEPSPDEDSWRDPIL